MIRIGIFFGGSSREREVSFSGGRTVYDNLDKTRFQAVPIFVDSFNQLVELDWEFVYKGSIRDFYPPIEYLPESPNAYQVYAESLNPSREQSKEMLSKLGRPLQLEELPGLIDMAFLALHGAYAEDGSIQGLLDWLDIPYTGSGILPSALGIDKGAQKSLFREMGLASPEWITVDKAKWLADQETVLRSVEEKFSWPVVVKSARQGSSIGISVVKSAADLREGIDKAFFRKRLQRTQWDSLNEQSQVEWVRSLSDIREGLGMPVLLDGSWIYLPEHLLKQIREAFAEGKPELVLEAADSESTVIIESFIAGREFSCIVIEDLDGQPVALPPTEIVKGNELFDYRSKYLPGLSRKLTPIDLESAEIEKIRSNCEQLFKKFHFDVYARIDGFYTDKGEVFLNDPNTTSGMMPSSFFFHQAAEIGLSPSAFLTYLLETSLKARIRTSTKPHQDDALLKRLQATAASEEAQEKIPVAVIMGGYSTERHISVESGRNIFEKLNSSVKYTPIPVFLTGNDEHFDLYLIPVNIMLKDNADDIKEKVDHYTLHPIIESIRKQCAPITSRYKTDKAVMQPEKIEVEQLKDIAKAVFIALHGRPGEDGKIQEELIKLGLPFNGSGVSSSQLTINKYLTNQKLAEHGFHVAKAVLVEEDQWDSDKDSVLDAISEKLSYPVIAKPADDGCSSAVKKINNAKELEQFASLLFRDELPLPVAIAHSLHIDPKEEIPMKQFFVVEELIDTGPASHFLEVTGGLLTHRQGQDWEYEVFEASESLAEKGILSLAEKFLAGQGQNITPARYDSDPVTRQKISDQVRAEFEKAARLLEIEGYARIDAFVRIFDADRVEVIFIEVNSLPGMTPATCIFHQTAINGYKPLDFIDQILEYGFERQQLQV